MAMFGAPVASEHHAVDACAAACKMQQGIGEFAGEVKARFGRGLEIRVGLHSGEIVVLSGGDGEKTDYDADGPTVPVAARMEQSAEPGRTYLTGATYALARRLDPAALHGVSAPLSAPATPTDGS